MANHCVQYNHKLLHCTEANVIDTELSESVENGDSREADNVLTQFRWCSQEILDRRKKYDKTSYCLFCGAAQMHIIFFVSMNKEDERIIVSMDVSLIVFDILQCKVVILDTFAHFSHPTPVWRPLLWCSRSNFATSFRFNKLEVWCYCTVKIA